MNERIEEFISLSTEDDMFNKEIFVHLIIHRCSEILNERALSFYDPNNKEHAQKESWDRFISWAIRDVAEEIKQEFGID